jgi:2-C-methyl-D-erythritol 4-phosphate cytidylyltransferase
MYKLGAVIILIFAAFFFGRSTGIDKITVKCQAKEIKQAQEVNNVQETDRKTKERVELETHHMGDAAIDADLHRLGIMRPPSNY